VVRCAIGTFDGAFDTSVERFGGAMLFPNQYLCGKRFFLFHIVGA
jgi:hypothetical protein